MTNRDKLLGITVEDLRKAAWYLNRQIERLEMSLGGQNA